MNNPENKHRPLIRAEVEGQGVKWVDPKTIRGFDYDPETIEIGGEEAFIRIIHYCMNLMGLGTSAENNFEWGARTYDGYWCDPNDVKNFPLAEPGPGRVMVPTYVFSVFKIRGKDFEWGTYAVVEEVLRGCLTRYQEAYLKMYCDLIQKGILDKMSDDHSNTGQ